MRACVKTVLRPLLLADAPTADLGLPALEGVPPFPDRADSFHAALVALLAYHGREVPYERLMGLTGAAFQIAWRDDLLWCPSALHVYDDEPLVALGSALGARWRQRADQGFEKALAQLRRQLALGHPVLTSGLRGEGEWSIVVRVGSLEHRPPRRHDEPPRPVVHITDRTAQGDEEYTCLEASPWCGYVPGPAARPLWSGTPLVWLHALAPAPDPCEVAAAALRRAVQASASVSAGRYRRGQEAYEAWRAALTDDRENEDAPALEIVRRAWHNTYASFRLADARRAAAAFLELTVEDSPRAAGRLMALAAREYQGVAAAFDEVVAPFDAAEGDAPWERFADPGIRREAAEALAIAQRRERTALAYLTRAERRLDED